MSETKIQWVRLADGEQELMLNAEGLGKASAEGKKLCIVKYKEQLFACAPKCPHAGGYMSEGYVDGSGNVVCPLHRYKFNLLNGRNVTGEGYFLKIYPVEVRPEGIFVGFEQKKILGLF